MDMSGSMTMGMATATASSAMAAATSHDMGDMGGMMGGCKISVSPHVSYAVHRGLAKL